MATWDIWTERGTSAYSGKGPARARGFEHHLVAWGRKPTVTAEVVFENFGVTHYTIDASAGTKPASTFRHADGLLVTAVVRAGMWAGTGDDAGNRTDFALPIENPDGVPVLPSFLARWVGIGSTVDTGVVGKYLPVPEDGFGAWLPPRKQWFPVMSARKHVVCEVVARPTAAIQIGRADVVVRPLAHVDPTGDVVATLYLDPETGAPVRYETLGCVLTVVDEDKARSRTPTS